MAEPVVHPEAFVHPEAALGEGVIVERGASVGPHCEVGPGTRLRERAILVERVHLGQRNDVHPFAVLGGDPQDLSFDHDADPGEAIIGDGNVFREGATVNRGCGGEPTRVGSACYFMAGAHVGHNAQLGDRVILTNNAAIAGHARVGAGAILSAGCGVHQFCQVGELVMMQMHAAISMHVPPFTLVAGVNRTSGLNLVGLRRSGRYDADAVAGLKKAFSLVYKRDGVPLADALEEGARLDLGSAAQRFLAFIRDAIAQEGPRRRGIVAFRAAKTHDEVFGG